MPADGHSRVLRSIAQELALARIQGPLLLAVSGGADSMAMLRAMIEIAEEIGLNLVVGHLDHCLRPDSNADADWVEEQTRRHDVPCQIGRLDVIATAAHDGRGIEETARRMRYDWLAKTAREVGSATVATAHTANDVSETILFHLLRGTGLSGLRGIARSRRLASGVRLIRPMLDVSRGDVLGYLSEIGQNFREDSTNANLEHSRNRLRHCILPELRDSINPRLDQALARLARQADETQEFLTGIASRELERSLLESGPARIRISTKKLSRRRRIVIRETLRLAWRRAKWPLQAMTADHWDALVGVVREGGRRTLPGKIDARTAREELILNWIDHAVE